MVRLSGPRTKNVQFSKIKDLIKIIDRREREVMVDGAWLSMWMKKLVDMTLHLKGVMQNYQF